MDISDCQITDFVLKFKTIHTQYRNVIPFQNKWHKCNKFPL